MDDSVQKYQIKIDATIKEALKRLDEIGEGILFVCDKESTLLGTLTDGDLRRGILIGDGLQDTIIHCYNSEPTFFVEEKYSVPEARQVMTQLKIKAIPIVDNDKKLVNVLFWSNILGIRNSFSKEMDIPVVIMAGGEGRRLRPFTMILPKPLIPINEEPIIKIIMDEFHKYGVNHFFITLNYKGDMIRTYLESINRGFVLDYIWEKKFLGTAGSLKMLPENIPETFIVSNCDIFISGNYRDLVKFHTDNKCALTVVGSVQHYRVPYGIIDFGKEGIINEIKEKPEIDMMINTGVYVLSKSTLKYIPDNEFYNMTDLIEDLLKDKQNVRVFPISEKSYTDIGQWEEYKKARDSLQFPVHGE